MFLSHRDDIADHEVRGASTSRVMHNGDGAARFGDRTGDRR
jgi:hypothetical protein